MRTREILGDDMIDSRDVMERIKYLELDEGGPDQDENEKAEFAALRALADEGITDWQYGATLILDSYFEDYARDLARDVGAISGDEKWPCTCIDWERAADELRMDYSAVEVGDYTYLVRS